MPPNCTAPKAGHLPGSQAEALCPAHRTVGATSGRHDGFAPPSVPRALPENGRHDVPVSRAPTFPDLAKYGFGEFVGDDHVSAVDMNSEYVVGGTVVKGFESRHPNGTTVRIEMAFLSSAKLGDGLCAPAREVSASVFVDPNAPRMTGSIVVPYSQGDVAEAHVPEDEVMHLCMEYASRDEYGEGLALSDVPGFDLPVDEDLSDAGECTVIEAILATEALQACRLGISPTNRDAIAHLKTVAPLSQHDPDSDHVALAKALYMDA